MQTSEDPDEPPSLVAGRWPGAILGGLLVVRSGVTVRAGANVLDERVAAAPEHRLDLVRHRCSLRTDVGADQWPYDDTFVEPAPKR